MGAEDESESFLVGEKLPRKPPTSSLSGGAFVHFSSLLSVFQVGFGGFSVFPMARRCSESRSGVNLTPHPQRCPAVLMDATTPKALLSDGGRALFSSRVLAAPSPPTTAANEGESSQNPASGAAEIPPPLASFWLRTAGTAACQEGSDLSLGAKRFYSAAGRQRAIFFSFFLFFFPLSLSLSFTTCYALIIEHHGGTGDDTDTARLSAPSR